MHQTSNEPHSLNFISMLPTLRLMSLPIRPLARPRTVPPNVDTHHKPSAHPHHQHQHPAPSHNSDTSYPRPQHPSPPHHQHHPENNCSVNGTGNAGDTAPRTAYRSTRSHSSTSVVKLSGNIPLPQEHRSCSPTSNDSGIRPYICTRSCYRDPRRDTARERGDRLFPHLLLFCVHADLHKFTTAQETGHEGAESRSHGLGSGEDGVVQEDGAVRRVEARGRNDDGDFESEVGFVVETKVCGRCEPWRPV